MVAVVDSVLEQRQDPKLRSALRRAGSESTARYAYGLLSYYWSDHPSRRTTICAFATLAAESHTVHQDKTVSLGKLSGDLVSSGALTEEGLARKLVVLQGASLINAKKLIRSILVVAARSNSGVDYENIYWVLSASAHPSTQGSRTLRRVLEDFYQERHRAQLADGDTIDKIIEKDGSDEIH